MEGLSVEDHARAIRDLSTVLRFAMLGVVAEAKSAALDDHVNGQMDQCVSDIAAQIDRHCRAIVELDVAQGAR